MDFVDCECQLLYKQNLKTWFEEKDRTKKFSDEDLKFVQIVQQKYKFKYDEEEDYDYREKFYLNGRFGHLFFSEADPVLFSFTELDGTKTSYKRSVEEDKRSQNGSDKEEISGEKKAESSESAISTIDYERIFIRNVIVGSNYGGKILAYSTKGHIFLIDLETKIGKLAAIWPIDPRILASDGSCYQLVPYDPCIKAAVNGEFSLVAATGPSDKEDEEEEIQIRIFNSNTKECSLKTLKLGSGLLHWDIPMISFNPCHPDLLYVSFCIESKSQYHSRKQVTDVERADENENDGDDNDNDNDGADDDGDDDDDDDDEDILLVLYDVSTEQVLTEMFGVSLIPCNFFYNTVESITFLKQGTMIVAYKAEQIVFLDAFSLELIGSVNVTGMNAVLGSHLLISSCKSQFAIFKCQNLSSSDELKYDVEVYKIPDEFSLKNFCRKVILDKVDLNHIDNLSLPNVLKNYLKL